MEINVLIYLIVALIPLYITVVIHSKTIQAKNRDIQYWQDRYAALMHEYKQLEIMNHFPQENKLQRTLQDLDKLGDEAFEDTMMMS